MTVPRPDLTPVPEDAPVADSPSAVVQGVERTTSSTSADGYKTEFVKIYQDAGVIGASMLTLLVLCFLLGMFCLRLLKMYVSLTESRDKLDATRTEFSSRMVEEVIALKGAVGTVITELRADHTVQTGKLDNLLSCQDRINDSVDRLREEKSGRAGRAAAAAKNDPGVS